MSEKSCVALLRGVNVGGNNRLPMKEFRDACQELGLANPRTYIQSGNLIFESERQPSEVETLLEKMLLDRFGIRQAVVVRTASDWRRYLQGNPFLAEAEDQPNLVMLALSKDAPPNDVASVLEARGTAGERAAMGGGALWLFFPAGSGRSRLSPGIVDRVVGSPATTRNWSTVRKIGEMLGLKPTAS